MSMFLIGMCVLVVCLMIYMWFTTKKYRSMPDGEILHLETDEAKMLGAWFNDNIKETYDELEGPEVAARFLQRNFNEDLDPSQLVIGHDLKQLHEDLGGKGAARFWSIRDAIGIRGEIAEIANVRVRRELTRNAMDAHELNQLHAIMNADLDTAARPYVQHVLKHRWQKLSELNPALSDIELDTGSYAYWKTPSLLDKPYTEHDVAFHILGHATERGVRLNLLCTDLEFNTLIQRLALHS